MRGLWTALAVVGVLIIVGALVTLAMGAFGAAEILGIVVGVLLILPRLASRA